jgi:hypothetical protein
MPESDHYTDDSFDETELPVSNPGVKLSPNEHAAFYDDVPGMSEARAVGKPKRDVRSLRRCLG